MSLTGRFVVLEGGDNTGHTTQAGRLAARLADQVRDVVHTFEPGGTPLGALLRHLLLDGDRTVEPEAEALLMAGDRAQHVLEVIQPALARCACGWSATGSCRRRSPTRASARPRVPAIEIVNGIATGGLEPDLVVVLDLPPEVATERFGVARDRLEEEDQTRSASRCTRPTGTSPGPGAGCPPTHPHRRRRRRPGLGRGDRPPDVTATWAALLGQDLSRLICRGAPLPSPATHPYRRLRGAGTADVARGRSRPRLVAPDGDERTVSLVARRVHPDVIEYEPERMVITVDQAREEIIPEAWRSPIESNRKVLILLEAERLQPEAANALLKTFEEPPDRTVMVLVSEAADELLDTVRSRCQRIDLGALDDATIEQALVAAGVHAPDVAPAARLSGGQLGRARDPAGWTAGRCATRSGGHAVSHVDGTGARAAGTLVEQMLDAVHEAIAAVKTRHAEELAEFDTETARVGYEPRYLRRLRRRIEERHPARGRLARRKAISEGIAVLETLYRDALAGPDASLRNVDRQPLVIDPLKQACALAPGLPTRVDVSEFNPNESLLLERLALHLPGSEPTPRG